VLDNDAQSSDGDMGLAKRKNPRPAPAAPTTSALGPAISSAIAAVVGSLMYLVVSNGFFVVGRPFLIGLLQGLVIGMIGLEPGCSLLSPDPWRSRSAC